jgi:hypothetical protein
MTFMLFQDLHGAGNTAITPETSSTNAGALSLANPISHIVTAGAETRTLAAGVEGQVKVLYMKTDGGDCVVTLTGNPAATDTLTFNDAGDIVVLMYNNDRWNILVNSTTTVA